VFTEVAELQDIYFEFDRYEIRPDAARRLQAHAAWLKARPGDLLLIEGHCDERGTEEYNLALGEHRAESTKNYLIAQGIAPARIAIVSYGELLPACQLRDESCWAQNRRAHFLVKRR
jgi:peptidoglycan-associated lipoprotein